MLIWVNTTEYTIGLDVTNDGMIEKAPPICKWAMGKTATWFKNYLQNKNMLIEWLEIEE